MSENTGDGKISSMHVMFAIACILQGSSFLTSFLVSITKQDSWIVVIPGFLVSLLISWIYIALVRKFPGITLVQMHDAVYGKGMGKTISILYIFFFFSLCVLNSADLGNFIENRLLPETPKVIIISIFLFACTWAVRKGIINMLRYSTMLCIITSAVILLCFFLLLKDIDLKRFLPVLTLSPMKYIQATHIITGIPFLEIVAFLMIFPVMRNQGDIKKVISGGLGIGAATLLVIIINHVAVLGNMSFLYGNPSFEMLRLINIGDIVTRLEVLFSFLYIILLFFKVTILFYATTMSIVQTFGLKRNESIATVIGALIVLYALVIFPNTAEHAVWGSTVGTVFASFYQIIFPLITLIIAAVRYPASKGEVKST